MENQAPSGGVSAILRSGLILEKIQRMFLLSIWATWTMSTDADEKTFSECSDLRIALTPPQRA